MRVIARRNLAISAAFLVCTLLVVFLERQAASQVLIRTLFFLAMALSLCGFAWANTGAFAAVRPPLRIVLICASALVMWVVTVIIAITINVNFYLGLGGGI